MIYRVSGDISCQVGPSYYNACCSSGTTAYMFKMFNWIIEDRYKDYSPKRLGPAALVRWDDE